MNTRRSANTRQGVSHFYMPVTGDHYLIVEDVNGDEVASVYFTLRGDCPAKSDHPAHDDVLEVLEALRKVYPGSNG